MEKSKWGVHEFHCCVLHGCKYGDPDCPVVNGLTKQKYICEQCEEEGVKSVTELNHTIYTDRLGNKIDLNTMDGIEIALNDIFSKVKDKESCLIIQENVKAATRKCCESRVKEFE